MSRVFADTSYWIALLSPRDPHHQRALAASKAHAADQIVTSDMVLAELLNAFSRNQYLRRAALRAVSEMRQDTRVLIEPQSRELFNAAVKRYEARADKEWGLTDCASMVIMEHLGITDVLTTDHHFEQAGFRLAM
jgi:predicted nucleic acid-binding protein